MNPRIVTIGVYGSDETRFFRSLAATQVDTFCDIRRRRGVRGAEYAFVNSLRLQKKLADLGIGYLYCPQLAPSQHIRDQQKEEDARTGIAKRSRERLSESFAQEFIADCLSTFDAAKFVEELGPDARVVALFCVEREAAACHRSLVADHLQQKLGLLVEHLKP